MHKITYDEVEKFLKTEQLSLKPGQSRVSFPIIARIHRRLQEGHEFSHIKVINDVISDGHHRFICHSLLKKEIYWDAAGENTTEQTIVEWKDIELDAIDYDTPKQKEEYRVRYDQLRKGNGL